MLEGLIRKVESGHRLPTDPWYQVIRPASPGTQAILGFSGHCVIVTDLPSEWIQRQLPRADLSLPLNPPFLTAMEGKSGLRVNNIDLILLATRCAGDPELPLTPDEDLDHPRVRRAKRYRDNVTVYRADGGVLVIGRGLGGRWEAAIEVDEPARGRGLGRALARAARHLVPQERPIWAQIAPGNAASVRAFLAAGYTPMGAEALLVP